MAEYEFTLKYAVPVALERETVEGRLFEAGCDDAVLGLGQKGRVALAFIREAESAEAAVQSAIRDVASGLPESRLIEVGPDWVGVSDVASIFQFSRQNMQKLFNRYADTFPLPLHEGKSAIWHLEEVLAWFQSVQGRTVDEALAELASVTRSYNIARELGRVEPGEREKIRLLADAS